jgi:putative hydrolase of the HAD superfamily
VTASGDGGRRVDGVLLDIDDTLVDTHGAFAAALAAVARASLPHLAGAEVEALADHWRTDAHGRYRAYTRGEQTYRSQRVARANDLHAAFGGPPLDDAGFDAWNAVFEQAFTGAWAAHPEAVAVLDRLLGAGIVVGALTNAATGYQTRKLRAVGLHGRIEVLVGVDTLGVGKPDPRVFAEACRRLGTAPGRTAYVGDELDVDARAATAAGLLGIWLDRPGIGLKGTARLEPVPGEIVIRSLDALPDVLGVRGD